MAYRFKTRSTTPGEYRLASGVLANLIALTDLRKTVGRGDGGTGTLVGVVDSDGAQHNYGTCSSVQAWAAVGIIYSTGTAAATGILTDTGPGTRYAATGVFAGAGNAIDASTGLVVGQVLTGISWYDSDGSHIGEAIEESHAAGEVIESAGGTYHEAAVGEVQDGVTFGALEALTGTYSPGGTYAEGQAAQLVTDKAEVNGNVAKIQLGETVLTGSNTGTLVGIVDSGGALHSYGTCDSSQSYSEFGIIHDSGLPADTGTLISDGSFAANGIVYNDTYHATTGLALNEVKDTVAWDDGDGSHIGNYAPGGGGYTYGDENADYVLTTAAGAGNYVAPGVADVRPISFGAGQTGTLANLVATDGAYTTLENSRNNDNGTVADDLDAGKSVKIRNTTITGAGVNATTVQAAVAGAAVVLTAQERLDLADAILKRSVANCEATASEWSLATVILGMSQFDVSGLVWTIYKTDGATVHAVKALTKDAAAVPITGVS